jgi:signal recognition particle subunit SRP19
VPKSLALDHPNIGEIEQVAEKLGLNPQLTLGTGYPQNPWLKTGMIMVEKKGSKEQVIRRIANQLLMMRRNNPE